MASRSFNISLEPADTVFRSAVITSSSALPSASASASALSQRAPGSLARHLSITAAIGPGTPGAALRSDGAGLVTCETRTAFGVPSKGNRLLSA